MNEALAPYDMKVLDATVLDERYNIVGEEAIKTDTHYYYTKDLKNNGWGNVRFDGDKITEIYRTVKKVKNDYCFSSFEIDKNRYVGDYFSKDKKHIFRYDDGKLARKYRKYMPWSFRRIKEFDMKKVLKSIPYKPLYVIFYLDENDNPVGFSLGRLYTWS